MGLSEMLQKLFAWLPDGPILTPLLGGLVLLLLAFGVDRITQLIVRLVVRRLATRTAARWDDKLVEAKVFTRLSHLAPLALLHVGLNLVPGWSAEVVDGLQLVTEALMLLAGTMAASAMLSAVDGIYSFTAMTRGRSIKTYVQLAKIFVYVVGIVLIISRLADEKPWALLSGIGAMTAVILLVFRDTILSFVASMQITSYDMVRVGDWIEMPAYGADGDVTEIGLHTIKVQNWNKTVTTIPTHKLISESFRNWRGMSDTGGRRIKRTLWIDMNSIRFLKSDDLASFEHIALLTDYIREKRDELSRWNAERPGAEISLVNSRNLTNVGTFRAYLVRYLADHASVHPDLTQLVRQLQPTSAGLPIEIYCFTSDIGWARYEDIQSDIFDHVLAILPEFGLRVFQSPTGRDLGVLGGAVAASAD